MIGGECTSCRGVEEKKVKCEVCAGITKSAISRTPSLPSRQALPVRSLSIDELMAAAVSFPQQVDVKDDTKDIMAATTTVPPPVNIPTTTAAETATKTVAKTTKKVCHCHHNHHHNNICCCLTR
jgi:hypothetical protein